jgi:hypothetical protein
VNRREKRGNDHGEVCGGIRFATEPPETT